MKQYLIPESGRFYKGNLHMHTTVSDGHMTPEEVKAEYKKRGYSVLAFTDHEIIVKHHDLDDKDFLTITAAEFSCTESNPHGSKKAKTYHFNVFSKDPDKDLISIFTPSMVRRESTKPYITEAMLQYDYKKTYSVECMNDMIARANAEGFLVQYNHPVWSLQDYSDWAGLRGLWAVEWQNTACTRLGMPDTIRPIDDLLRQNERVFPTSTDDAHASAASLKDCFGGWVMIKAAELEYGAIMTASEKGDFYSSQGPSIRDLFIEDGVVTIRTSPAARIFLSTERRFYKSVSAEIDPLVEASFDLNKYIEDSAEAKGASDWWPYFRITVTDAQGMNAQTRAYFLDELQA